MMNNQTRSLVRHAHAIAREVGARAVMLQGDIVEADGDLNSLVDDVNFRVILISRRGNVRIPEHYADLCQVARVPDLPMTRAGQIRVATLVAASHGMIQAGDRIVCLCGLDRSGVLDTLFVFDLGEEIELLPRAAGQPLPSDIAPAVFQRLLTIAGEIATEGREGRAIGTLFVIGDTDRVLIRSRQLVINPFQGYPEADRNILDPRLEETIKAYSAIDGAFIVRGDGVLIAAGRYLVPEEWNEERVPRGLGSRHQAALTITLGTTALTVCISQSTGTISVYKEGVLQLELAKPRSPMNETF